MSLTIEQESRYQGDDWWKWSIWLQGPEQELDEVESVEYKLHPTFPRPVRTVSDRASNFRLATHGWGVFPIQAKIMKRNGEVVRLRHQLVLRYDDGTPAQL
jgi:transcription initiation factor IIF auxiliary subunit